MFSFEGHFKTPRKINYNNEKEVGKVDILEKAKLERGKRALVIRQNASATIIQNAYRHFIIRKIKRQTAFNEFTALIKEIANQTKIYEGDCLLQLIVKTISKLLLFCDGSNLSDQSLRILIDILIKANVVKEIVNNHSVHAYHNTVMLSLLLRVTSRFLSSMDDNSAPTSYNTYLRFFEICLKPFEASKTQDINSNYYFSNFLSFLIKSNYFHYVSIFVRRQLMKNEPAEDCFKQTKVHQVLKIMLAPIHHLKKSPSMLSTAVIYYINNVYSKSQEAHIEHVTNIYKLMNIALLDMILWHDIVDILYKNYTSTGGGHPQISRSTGLCYFLLAMQPTVKDSVSIATSMTCSKIVILFYNLSDFLINNDTLFLSNNIVQISDSDQWITPHDNFDFEMKETSSSYDSSDRDTDDSDSEITKAESLMQVENRVMTVLEQEIAYCLKYRFAHVVVPLAIQNESDSIDNSLLIDAVGYVYHLLVLHKKIIGGLESKTFILKLIQTSKSISRRLWKGAVDQVTIDSNKSIMDLLIRGESRVSASEMDLFFGKLLCFANCLHWKLLSVQDLDLISLSSDRSSEVLEFSSEELCAIVLRLRDIMCGLIVLIYPSSSQLTKTQTTSISLTTTFMEKLTKIFIELQRVVTRLYNRDVRKGLKMSGKRLEWVKTDVCRINVNSLHNFRYLLQSEYKFGKMMSQLTTWDMRQFVVLKEMPFIVPIGTRMKILKQIIASIDAPLPYITNRVSVRVRRDHIYDDAFNQITKNTMPNLRSHLKIEFIDRFGIDEVGIDGGGLLREFLSSIVMEACDPKRGLFVNTTNNLLYPNPEIETLYPDNWKSHFYFIGRMIGLILYKGLLVEVPFAPFFLQKLFSNKSSREEIDIDNLQYLDEDLYRNLLSLKSMPSVEDIHLDFTMSRHCCGVTSTVELKPNGANIMVTNDNKIEYIYLVADYKLHQQISSQTVVIISGLNDILPIDCFRLFDLDELSFIVTGGGAAIDLDDLRRNTIYHGQDDVEMSDTIQFFWEVVFNMTEEEKRSFIQFVTSLSRAPLLGFGELSPKFAIAIVPDTDRLPTASTCLNLLKLPAYKNLEEMRHRLLYAIGSDTGFHLS